ncbi:conjugal transfer protein TrbJ [Pseudomonas oryzihabitans]|nr:conjugal transfer protein TrbJ [Pseudomonas psychrotolerans]KTT31310.1 conjugal transfer protein TrbJ [Pseudomonas psychrotolerans]KTT78518.1 conjugal transfer protein TrbJ [Pseudomonas psychrotolerans]
MKSRFLAAKLALTVAVSAALAVSPVQAGIPVIDAANLTQTVMSAVENVAQTLKQIQQYQTQLQQYENMLQNTLAPAAYIWDQAQATMNNLLAAQNTLNYYKNQLGSLDSYLGKFQDVAYYRSSPCFNGLGGCTPTEKAAMEENRRLANESQKKANDALFRSLDKQQDALTADARTLQQIQGNAQGATGQLQAMGYANQLASQQANQLLQIRAMLLAQQNAIAAKAAADQDQAARDQAMEESMTKGSYNMPTPQTF